MLLEDVIASEPLKSRSLAGPAHRASRYRRYRASRGRTRSWCAPSSSTWAVMRCSIACSTPTERTARRNRLAVRQGHPLRGSLVVMLKAAEDIAVQSLARRSDRSVRSRAHDEHQHDAVPSRTPSMRDAELLEAAVKSELSTEKQVQAQATRLLTDPRAQEILYVAAVSFLDVTLLSSRELEQASLSETFFSAARPTADRGQELRARVPSLECDALVEHEAIRGARSISAPPRVRTTTQAR